MKYPRTESGINKSKLYINGGKQEQLIEFEYLGRMPIKNGKK